jgi:GH24 family phage-related lysozyme (muramidase)
MALFTEGLPNENFTTFYDYDKHGNITRLTRFGQTGHNTYGIIDDLTYSYNNSNQVRNITDSGPNVTFNHSQDFKDYTKGSGIEYTYNKNGARITDLNKGISDLTYNLLNLPKKMDIKSPVAEARNEYIYSANGQKLKVIRKWNPAYLLTPQIGTDINVDKLTLTKTIDYTGNKIYEDGALKLILTDNGYLDYVENKYYFYVRDHLGNNRVVTDLNLQSVQSTQYYPFGMAMGISLGQVKQPYKFGGKELDVSFGLNMYDQVFRLFGSDDPTPFTADPHAEYYPWMSPYTQMRLNPLRYTDPTGMDWYEFENENGTKSTIWQEGNAKTATINEQIYNNIGTTYFEQYDWGAISYNQNNIADVYLYTPISELNISNKGLNFLIDNEGVELKPYDDSKGYATIGVGHLIGKHAVTEQDRKNWAWFDTKQEAMNLLQTDLSGTYEAAVKSLVKVPLMQFQYDAMVSFTFNVGVSGLGKSNFLKELNGGNYNGNLMLNYRRPPEIIPRREREVNLFNKAIYKP